MVAGRIVLSLRGCFRDDTLTALRLTDPTTDAATAADDDDVEVFVERRAAAVLGLCCRATTGERRPFCFIRLTSAVLAVICCQIQQSFSIIIQTNKQTLTKAQITTA